MILPEPIQALINAFERLPGIGPKSASRLAFYLLRAPEDVAQELSEALRDLKGKVAFCQQCFNITEAGRILCEICEDPRRDPALICVVEEPQNVFAIEKTRDFKGAYHVLGGAISPLQGIGPDELKIKGLLARVERGGVSEVILATNPNVEGEATAIYLARLLKPLGVKVTRIAMGVPVGSDLEYADEVTVHKAMEGRREV